MSYIDTIYEKRAFPNVFVTVFVSVFPIEFYQEVSFIVPAKGIQGETHFAVGIGVEVAIVVWDTSIADPVATILNRANITEFRDDIVIAGKADAKGRLWVGESRMSLPVVEVTKSTVESVTSTDLKRVTPGLRTWYTLSCTYR